MSRLCDLITLGQMRPKPIALHKGQPRRAPVRLWLSVNYSSPLKAGQGARIFAPLVIC